MSTLLPDQPAPADLGFAMPRNEERRNGATRHAVAYPRQSPNLTALARGDRHSGSLEVHRLHAGCRRDPAELRGWSHRPLALGL
jgi:hypothetical protein